MPLPTNASQNSLLSLKYFWESSDGTSCVHRQVQPVTIFLGYHCVRHAHVAANFQALVLLSLGFVGHLYGPPLLLFIGTIISAGHHYQPHWLPLFNGLKSWGLVVLWKNAREWICHTLIEGYQGMIALFFNTCNKILFTWTFFFLLFSFLIFTMLCWFLPSVQFSSVQSLSHVWLFATPWTAACQASLSITNSWSLPKLMSIEHHLLGFEIAQLEFHHLH